MIAQCWFSCMVVSNLLPTSLTPLVKVKYLKKKKGKITIKGRFRTILILYMLKTNIIKDKNIVVLGQSLQKVWTRKVSRQLEGV